MINHSGLIIKECQKCGATLVQIGNELVCDHCGSRYEMVNSYPQGWGEPPAIQPVSPQPPKSVRPGPPQEENKERRIGQKGFVLLAVLLGICLLIGIFSTLLSSVGTNEKLNPETRIELDMFQANSSALPDKNPADFIHESNFSYGVIYNGGTSKEFKIGLLVENKQNYSIDQDAKADHMHVERVSVVDNLERNYDCRISEINTNKLDPNKVYNLASFYCHPILLPEVKYIQIHIQFSNWGSKEFEITTSFDPNKLEIEYRVERFENDASLDIWFYATEPQCVDLYFDDISLLDGKGDKIPISCEWPNVYVEMENYSVLAQDYGHGRDISCDILRPITQDINAINLVMTIRGKTISLITPIDSISSAIIYDSRKK